MKNKWFWVRAVISVSVLAVLLVKVGASEMWAVIQGENILFAAVVVALAFADRILVAFKWNILVRALDIHVSFKEAVRSYLASSFVGLFLPTSVGGDILRIFIVGVDKSRREEVAATIVVERLLALVALFLLLVLSSSVLFFYSPVEHVGIVVLISLFAMASSAGVIWLSFHQLPLSLLKWFPAKVSNILRKIAASYQKFKDRKRDLAVFFALSFVAHLFPIFCNCFVAVSLGIVVSPFAFFVVIPVVLVFARLPISLDGLGIQEGLYWALFQMAGMTAAQALSLAIMARILTIIALLPGAWLFMLSPVRKEVKDGE